MRNVYAEKNLLIELSVSLKCIANYTDLTHIQCSGDEMHC
jgi:hypothetical protein